MSLLFLLKGDYMSDAYKYEYVGAVVENGILIMSNWSASTYASSSKKAINNLKFRFKKENNKPVNSKIELPGKLTQKVVVNGN